ncbi:dimethyladenosine transferase [Nocardioides mangrovicus]|uniref:Dimethyladenosine transferase n=1 Tax=Nocardioides mangrovicus TaxID=2478913 RepID=A0A3L8P0L3_9ACTN|nr:SRPBCC family protein [Nocardioides mangrovicus]RLV47918.1 dimethyladenosine transferase [Nocardioides mangrovicus]
MSQSHVVPGVVAESIDVDTPPERVFAILSDPYQHPRIDGSGSLTGAIRGPHQLSEGASFGVDMKLFGLPYKIRNTVVEYEEGRLIAWRHFNGHRWRYRLEPRADGAGTRVTEEFDYSRVPGYNRRILELLGFPERNRQGIKDTLPRLKAEAEGQSA